MTSCVFFLSIEPLLNRDLYTPDAPNGKKYIPKRGNIEGVCLGVGLMCRDGWREEGAKQFLLALNAYLIPQYNTHCYKYKSGPNRSKLTMSLVNV